MDPRWTIQAGRVYTPEYSVWSRKWRPQGDVEEIVGVQGTTLQMSALVVEGGWL